jgi:hypothetical protein
VEPRIPLGLYATVITAFGAGIPRDSVLRAAGLADDEWELESAAWARTLAARIEADPASLESHDAAILAARERLSRVVEPLDTDVSAWLTFQSAWVSASEPSAFLRSRGLTTLDMLRVSARWAARFAKDEPLRMAALACMERPGGPVPEIRVGPWPLESAFAGLWSREEVPPVQLPPSAAPPSPEGQEAPVWAGLPGKPPVTEPPPASSTTKGPPAPMPPFAR